VSCSRRAPRRGVPTLHGAPPAPLKPRSDKPASKPPKARRAPSNRAPATAPPGALPQSPARRWLFRLIAAVLLPLALLALLEGALRLVGYGYDPGFFEAMHSGGQDLLVNNEQFGLRFFPPELERFSGPIRMAAHKPPGTYRIFILGESAAMGDPEPAYGAGRFMEVLLRERFPGARFEVVNTAITAINSHVIVPIARECARHEGDLWIIYMGNNEMVGPFGAATVFGVQAPPLPLVRLSLAVQRTRVGQLLMALARHVHGNRALPASWGGMEMFLGSRLAPVSPGKERVYRSFRRNLQDIVQAGTDAGAKIVLNTIAVNLRDCPPFASMVNTNLLPADHARFERLEADAASASSQGNPAAAAESCAQMARLDSGDADVQFRWASCLLALTNYPGRDASPRRPQMPEEGRLGEASLPAREHLQRACDNDALPFRADSRINGALADEAAKQRGRGLVLLDAASALGTNQLAGVCGQETFYEHVHFNFDGSYRLGLAWAKQVERSLPAALTAGAKPEWLGQAGCEDLLGLTDWNRSLVLQSVLRRYAQPPLSSQPNNAQRTASVQATLATLRGGMNAAGADRSRQQFQEALQHAPDDHYLHENFAGFLQSIGDLPAATAEWRRVHELLPRDFLSLYQLGRMLMLQGQWAEAESCLEDVVAAHPSMVEAWLDLGRVHAGREQYERAIADYEQARRLRPQDPRALCDMGKALEKLHRRPEAIERLRQSIQVSPNYWEAHFELGGEYAFDDKVPEAKAEFAEAVRLQPGNPRCHFNLGVMLAKQNQFEAAQREFEATLRLEPDNQTAKTYLAQAKALGARQDSGTNPPPGRMENGK